MAERQEPDHARAIAAFVDKLKAMLLEGIEEHPEVGHQVCYLLQNSYAELKILVYREAAFRCRRDGDCEMGEVCRGGVCVPPC